MLMPLEKINQIRADYLSGMSLAQVQDKWRRWTRRQVRMCLDGLIRPQARPPVSPSVEEVAQRKFEISSQWSAEQARARWVGRYAARAESLGSCLSKALREMGGEG